jgi:2-polyprenyl-3-methyl-5-hydroxy-6-metoxy-1,4-benzoquinol methylase
MADLQVQVAPFDALADTYDEIFTRSLIGRAQRAQVWRVLEQAFSRGQRVVEINCGTGEDALFLAHRGVAVLACDSSRRMIGVAQSRKAAEAQNASVEFRLLPTERLAQVGRQQFDGAFSNFGGLNCVEHTGPVAAELAKLLKPGAPMILCLANQFCAWEMLWYALQGNWGKAFRRRRRVGVVASLGLSRVNVWYPTVSELLRTFAPWFRLKSYRGIGVCVPPSYLEHWVRRHSSFFRACEKLDGAIARWPVFRSTGDHVLLHFERNGVANA